MLFRVYLMRDEGRPIPWRIAQHRESFVGAPVMTRSQYGGTSVPSMSLRGSDGNACKGVKTLFEPVLSGFSFNAFRIRGIERIDEGRGMRAVVQEWHCVEP
jgi:hypothetical protein